MEARRAITEQPEKKEQDNISLDIDSGMRIINLHRLNKGFCLKFPDGYPD